ncbi:hypothetical protein [Frigoriglobus tundricola]|uniref:Uncharacterized protein n=1 Tax=Frigoriglobus tundricola TaxID=2774151 RepID=A0A6M5YPT0_9BACT|nr:hypothetical protein [Frigoriglobus tundricola]QJW95303.1 hypothetical protein FTUN_2845 [Frigoriglobus tundricola]
MRKMMAISVASSLLGYAAVYFIFFSKPAPAPEPEQPAVATEPAEPVVLAQVIDVTDLDPLLSPPPAPTGGVPFDTADASETLTVTAPAPIPLAAD